MVLGGISWPHEGANSLAATSLVSSSPFFLPPSYSTGCSCLRALACALPSAWNNLSLDVCMLAPSGPPRFNWNATSSWRLLSWAVILVTLNPITLHCFTVRLPFFTLYLSPTPRMWGTGGGNLVQGLYSTSPQDRNPSLAFSVGCVKVPTIHQVIYFFSQDIVWHTRNTVDKNLNPVRKQKDLFGKMKQNIFLSSINIWWMLTRYFQNKKHIETAYVSGQMKL